MRVVPGQNTDGIVGISDTSHMVIGRKIGRKEELPPVINIRRRAECPPRDCGVRHPGRKKPKHTRPLR